MFQQDNSMLTAQFSLHQFKLQMKQLQFYHWHQNSDICLFSAGFLHTTSYFGDVVQTCVNAHEKDQCSKTKYGV